VLSWDVFHLSTWQSLPYASQGCRCANAELIS
jgi:hypothetical protein